MQKNNIYVSIVMSNRGGPARNINNQWSVLLNMSTCSNKEAFFEYFL